MSRQESLPLFRSEALSAHSNQSAGTIVLARPMPMRLAAGIAAVLTVLLVVYLTVGEYTRKVRVAGLIVPAAGAPKAVAPQFGRIIARRVQDGDLVKAGQVLYELSSDRISNGGGIEARIADVLKARNNLLAEEHTLQIQQLEQHGKSQLARSQIIETEIERLGQEIDLQQDRITNIDKMVRRYRNLKEQGFISEMQLSQSENELSDQIARKHNLERAKLASARDLLQAQEEARQIRGKIRLTTTQTERAVATLDQETAEHYGRRQIQVLAPVAGTVTALVAEPGQSVQAGATLATVIPAGSELEAHLLVPSRAIGFIESGQTVLLRLSAFPYQKFGQAEGTILRVEHSPISGEAVNDTSASSSSEPIYRIVVKLTQQSITAYGRDKQYRTGMRLEADIQQDRRRLIEWVIEPLISGAKGHAR